MEENLHSKENKENSFVFSKAVKAGKRIYYFDVKNTKNNDDMYLSITESKKNITGEGENIQFSFMKQRLLLYKEDFYNFIEALKECTDLIDKMSENKPDEKHYKNRSNYITTKETTNYEKIKSDAPKSDFDDISFDI